ncbi:hypothetical protein [Vibrio parahaemolyticus]|uniref:hypothetical protein n=1 Tax=Vibrio parahaemolyticus TaxID=670 RepID=UPI0006B264CD|nr:hypothetical protein [Vibrio parahaemolyticus]
MLLKKIEKFILIGVLSTFSGLVFSGQNLILDYQSEQSQISKKVISSIEKEVEGAAKDIRLMVINSDFDNTSLSDSDLEDYNSIIILGDKERNKRLMKEIIGFGISRDVILISNAHSEEKREVNTFNVNYSNESNYTKMISLITNILID